MNPNFVTTTHPTIFNMIGSSPICATALIGLSEIECNARDIVIVDGNTARTQPQRTVLLTFKCFLRGRDRLEQISWLPSLQIQR